MRPAGGCVGPVHRRREHPVHASGGRGATDPHAPLTGAVRELAEAGWDALLDRAGNGDPLRRLAVLRILAMDEAEPLAVVARREGVTVAAAALAVERRRGLRVAHTLGPSAGWFDAEPPVVDDEAADLLARELAGQSVDLLTLQEIRPASALVRSMARVMRVRARREPPTYRVHTDQAAGRLTKRRREAGRLMRRALRAGHSVDVHTLTTWADIRPVLDEAVHLHHRRWSGADADAFVATAHGRAVVTRVLGLLGGEERLRLTRIVHDGRLVAFALAAVAGPRAVMYRTAHDRSLMDGSGLGASSLVASLDALASEGIVTVDLGSGGDAFKRGFADPERVITLQGALSGPGRVVLVAAATRAALVRRPLGGLPPPRGGHPTGRSGVGHRPSVT